MFGQGHLIMNAASIRLLSKSFCDNFIAKMSLGCAKQ